MIVPYSQYKTGSYPFPEDFIDPKKKDHLWLKKVAEGIISMYIHDKACIPYSKLKEMGELVDLANGNQSVEIYKKMLLDESEEGGGQQGYMNIDFDVFSVMPKFMRIIEGMMEQTEHQIVATAVDPKSSKEKEEMKLRAQFSMQFKQDLEEIENGLGIESKKTFLPETTEELELYSGMGGFRLARETEMEEAIDYTLYISDWRTTVKPRIIRDMITWNSACVKDYTDNYTGKVKVRYVDPQCFVGQRSTSYDYRKMRWAGEIIKMDIADIIKQDPDVDRVFLSKLAKWYNGINGNMTLSDTELATPFDSEDNKAKWVSFSIDVLDFEYKSINSEFKTTRKNQYGNDIMYPETWGKTYDTEKKKTDKYDIHVVYRGKWVIGTDIMFDYGLQHNVPRPEGKEVSLSYHFFGRKDKSIVMSSRPCLHQIALAHYKLQNAMANAAPPGIAIEFTALQNMKLGGNKLEPIELLKIRKQTGDLLYKSTTHRGQPNIPGGFRPIQELSGGIGKQLNEFITVFSTYIDFIREATGINQIADASNPNPEQSVGGSELAIAATNNALRPIYSAYIAIKENAAKNSCLRIQLLIKHSNKAYEGYIPVIGRIGAQILRVSADVVDANYYIKFEAKPTEKRKEIIRQAAIAAMSPDRDGVIGIELPDFLLIERLLENGNLKFAELYLNYRSKKNKDHQQQLQRENMLLDQKGQQDKLQMEHQLKLETTTHETNEKIRFETAKLELEEKYKNTDHERKMKEIALTSTMKSIEGSVGQEQAPVSKSA